MADDRITHGMVLPQSIEGLRVACGRDPSNAGERDYVVQVHGPDDRVTCPECIAALADGLCASCSMLPTECSCPAPWEGPHAA